MNIILKFEKTFLLIAKISIILLLSMTYFSFFSNEITQLKIINRTSIISFSTFIISIIFSIKLYGGFEIKKKQTKDIRNSIILGTLIADIVTFSVIYIMGFSTIKYYEFSYETSEEIAPLTKNINLNFSNFLGYYISNKVLPGILTLIIALIFQIIIIYIFTRLFSLIYFKINKPKKIIIIYEDKENLTFLVSKIIKNPNIWKLNELIKFDNPNILDSILNNDAVFFAAIPKFERTFLIDFCYKNNKELYISPDLSDILLYNSSNLTVDDSTVLYSTNDDLSLEQKIVKRAFDIIFSTILLIFTFPVMVIFAIAIKICDRGPILFNQKRITKNGKEFKLLKFRSMIVDAERETGVILAKEDDERVTKIGKILRRYRIDELPQIFNILKGDLSIVGPRPERLEYIKKFEKNLPEFKYRLKVKAGLTGLAQIMSKYNTTPKDKLILDITYIQKYSVWLDIKIMLCTLTIFLKSDSVEGMMDFNKEVIEIIEEKLKK